MKKLFYTKFSVAVIALIPTCIGINMLGKMIAAALRLPLWLDCLGTGIAAFFSGPIVGGICGALSNLIYGATTGDSIALIYALTSLGIGIAVGIMARLGFMQTFGKALVTAGVAGLAAVIISTPLNIIFYGGTTGNVWGDGLFGLCRDANLPVLLASFLDELVVDVPDKLLSIILVFIIIKGLPHKLTALFAADDTLKSLD